MLRLEAITDVLVEFLVRARRLGRVQIAAARNIAVWRVEIEGARDGVESWNWEVLDSREATR